MGPVHGDHCICHRCVDHADYVGLRVRGMVRRAAQDAASQDARLRRSKALAREQRDREVELAAEYTGGTW